MSANNLYQAVEGLDNLLDLNEIKPPSFYTVKAKYRLCDALRPLQKYWPDLCDWEEEAGVKADFNIKSEVMSGSSTSIKNLMHFAQLIRTRKMVEFDPEHGEKINPNSVPSLVGKKVG
mmetsp:Transcript_24344/g.30202  ORF Transcript_24344/g.30202 Transcript_24344/m.30202 type:complete len:118 (-) Transcript_24344:788-1141(-)|eukprot:CAMPEP_0170452832 /NCGR_PEP_ID=MMETSP0123-20130129/1603_1 /TAXON_ID=182087 /ORGANISM="Favella ehrenbergii, Strain Fehren 1" /LENGTH=117 /DNA_ID=CAMNT_0010714977 /DNA_START=528 /DNA_END=881 /DNA_ORIENTATION=+